MTGLLLEEVDVQCLSLDYRGRSFTGDLSNQDFSGADIRGAKFDRATLKGTKFIKAKAGLQPHWSIIWITGILLLCSLTGILSTSAASCTLVPLNSVNVHEMRSNLPGLLNIAIPLLLFIVLLKKGVAKGFIYTFGIVALAIPLSLAYDVFIAHKLVLVFISLFCLPLCLTLIFTAVSVGSLAVNLANTVLEKEGTVSATIIMVVAALVCKQTLTVLSFENTFGSSFGDALSLGMVGLIAYTTYGTTKEGNKELAWLQKLTGKLVARTGTSFKDADLTDADFERAILKNADFTRAKITRTNWHNAKKLVQACIQGTYLEELEIRKLVTSKVGKNRIFDGRADLFELNLQGADLEGASFIGANLSEANLQRAYLSNSKLVDTQLYRANLTSARLTGSCIQNWGISTETHLDGIQCDYVYMRYSSDSRVDRRKPDNDEEDFKTGEFSQFIAPFIKILGLYHSQFTDPINFGKIETLDFTHQKDDDLKAIIFAFTRLLDRYDNINFKVVSVYSVGQNIFNIGIAVNSGIATTTLSSQYKQYFEQYSQLSEQEKQKTIGAKNEEPINKLKRLLSTARDSPGSYIIENINFAGAQNVSVGNINQVAANTITNAFNTVAQSSAPQELKVELEKLNQAVTEMVKALPDEKQREVAQDLKTFTDEATSQSPRRKWYELSAEGLVEAAKAVGEVAIPVVTATKAVLSLLSVLPT